MTKTKEKRIAIAKLRELLKMPVDVAAIDDLYRMSINSLNSLAKHVEHVKTQAFDEGREHSDGKVQESAPVANA